jgi:hypothetical protein
MVVFGITPGWVAEGYLTDPVFLLEPVLFAIAVVHWAYGQEFRTECRRQIDYRGRDRA